MGLVRSLQPWDTLLLYCNKQFKKCIAPFLRLTSGALSASLWCLCQEVALSLFTVVKFLPHKSPEWSSLVSGLEAKSSLDIMNLTFFTISYHMGSTEMSFSKPQEMVKDREAWPAAVHGAAKVRHSWATEMHEICMWIQKWLHVWLSVWVCVCYCEWVFVCVCACVCVAVRNYSSH